ncbi:unnamed protein product [Pleuronectes platessa]|uniref:Uncharacterized protein n=1 Tax=Pleuronectes platessa TaxID=8262 RepID=A0A9N7YIJ2_PLEPL|nr:unnamed protein product [Pleuronectes platessa]
MSSAALPPLCRVNFTAGVVIDESLSILTSIGSECCGGALPLIGASRQSASAVSFVLETRYEGGGGTASSAPPPPTTRFSLYIRFKMHEGTPRHGGNVSITQAERSGTDRSVSQMLDFRVAVDVVGVMEAD